MAKSTEQKIADTFENATSARFNPIEFARIMSNTDYLTQKAFYDSMVAYITYKATDADYNFRDLSRESIAWNCQKLRDTLKIAHGVIGNINVRNTLL